MSNPLGLGLGHSRTLAHVSGRESPETISIASYWRAYSSAACAWNSKPTNRSPPTTSASWPGSITYASPGSSSSSVPSRAPTESLPALDAETIWVDMSTVSPRASRELSVRVHALGAAMLDAPVSGSVPQVQAGTLTIMVGGDNHAYARVEPILRELGTPTHIGGNGQGLVLKLAINISLAVQMLAFADGLLLAECGGIDPSAAADVMAASPIGSPMLKARLPLILELPDEAWFDIGLMQKDIVLALEAARELRVPLPSAAAADEMLTLARARGHEHHDLAALLPDAAATCRRTAPSNA